MKATHRDRYHRSTRAAEGRSGTGERSRRATEIMTVALDLFSEKDYAAVTTTEIAKIIGVRHSLIYYYFENKDALFHQTIENFVYEVLSNYEDMRKMHDDPVDRIEYWFENNIEFSRTLRKLIKIMFDYSGPKRRPLSTDKLIKKFYDQERSILSSGISQGIKRGIFNPVDADRTAAFVSTHIDGIFFSSLMRTDVDLVACMAQLKEVLWQILVCEATGQAARGRKRSSQEL